ncbi:ABC transporter permease [Bacillus sp. NPDC077027]|uniref:ABC transporter permease n=1 Tax=Bacillus sp. NPDC077027 TaxID=3390548 RepID=UPI003CFE81C9
MFMMFAISSATSSIHEEYKNYTWQRLLSSPVHKYQVLLGYLFAYFILGWIQLSVLMVILSLFFHVYWGNIIHLLLFGSIVIGMIVALSITISSVSKTKNKQRFQVLLLL